MPPSIIIVRMFHGSIRRWKYRQSYKEIGGLFGGHVVLQIDDHVYDFIYRDKSQIHIFSNNRSKNCVFQKQTIAAWETIVKDKKETSVFIPVNDTEKQFLLDFYHRNIDNPSYDYSFFGHRCASSCYVLLKDIQKIKGGHFYRNAFYPGQLLRKLLRQARLHDYKVVVKAGSSTRKWGFI
jgi:hypothetical protein